MLAYMYSNLFGSQKILTLKFIRLCSPLHDEEGVGHVILLALGSVQLLGQDVVHGALQEVRHLDVPVSVKHTVQCFSTAAKTAH